MDVLANFRIARPSAVVATPLLAALSASTGAPTSEIVAGVRDLPTTIRYAPLLPPCGAAAGAPLDAALEGRIGKTRRLVPAMARAN
jgi:hypothetical protein